jgi:hypothetical protein
MPSDWFHALTGFSELSYDQAREPRGLRSDPEIKHQQPLVAGYFENGLYKSSSVRSQVVGV